MVTRPVNKKHLLDAIRSNPRASLIVNTHSRRGEQAYEHAKTLLEARGFEWTATHVGNDPRELPHLVRARVEAGDKLVIVGGGDGTISSIVDELAYKDVALGILPLGTGNSFARTLGLPLDLEGAIRVIAEGKVVDVDLGQAGDDYFANVASIGISTHIARRIPRALKRRYGQLAYGITGASVMLRARPFECRFVTKERDFTVKTHQVLIANGRAHGAGIVGPDAHADNRRLSVFTVGEGSRMQLLRTWLAFLRHQHWQRREANYFTTNEVLIETTPPQHLDIDGEVTTVTPTRFRVAEEALNVLVPQAFEEPWD